MDLEALYLVISHGTVGRELTQVLEAAESWGRQLAQWLCEQEGRPLLLVPVLPEPSCTEPPLCAPERLGVMSWVIKDPQSVDGNSPYVMSACDGFAGPGINTCRSWWEQCSLTSLALALSTVWPQPLCPVRRCGLAIAQALKPALSGGSASSPITYQHWRVPLSVEFSQWHSLDPWSWHTFLS